jgi:hypothetical protein
VEIGPGKHNLKLEWMTKRDEFSPFIEIFDTVTGNRPFSVDSCRITDETFAS